MNDKVESSTENLNSGGTGYSGLVINRPHTKIGGLSREKNLLDLRN